MTFIALKVKVSGTATKAQAFGLWSDKNVFHRVTDSHDHTFTLSQPSSKSGTERQKDNNY